MIEKSRAKNVTSSIQSFRSPDIGSVTRSAEMEKKVMEMVEKRMNELLEQVVQAQGGKMEEMTQAIATINLQNQKNKIKMGEGKGESSGDAGDVRYDWGRTTRYEFPKFNGDGFEGWVMRAEYYFEVTKVPEKDQVRVAAIHLEGKALQWHRGFTSLHGERAYANWACYISALAARFGAQAYEDPLADLRNLKQRGSLQEYMDVFDELYPRAGLSEDQALSFFLSGLLDELQMPVRMFRPKGLAEAYSLAKLQELTVRALGGRTKGVQGGGQSASNNDSSNKPYLYQVLITNQLGIPIMVITGTMLDLRGSELVPNFQVRS